MRFGTRATESRCLNVVRDSGPGESRVEESRIAEKSVQINSIHEFPTLQNGLLKKTIVSQRFIDVSHDPLCNSCEVAIDNQQISSNSKSNALGGNGKSKSKSKDQIESRHDVL